MKVSELVAWLLKVQEKYGDIPVVWQSLTREFSITPIVVDRLGEKIRVRINY